MAYNAGMRFFVGMLGQGKSHLENTDKARNTRLGIRIAGIFSIVLLGWCIWSFSWMLFILSFLQAGIILTVLRNLPNNYEIPKVARIFDQDYGFKDILTTAQEFQSQEQTNPIVAELADDADRKARSISFPENGKRDKIEIAAFLLFLFSLLILNFWNPFRYVPPPIFKVPPIQKALERLPDETPKKEQLQKELEELKKAVGDQAKQEAAKGMQETLGKNSPGKSLQKLGETLQKNSQTSECGKSLSNGETGKAARQAGEMARQFEKGLSDGQRQNLAKTLQEAIDGLKSQSSPGKSGGETSGVQDSLQKMKDSLDKPSELGKATDELSRELQNLEKQQQACDNLDQALQKQIENCKKCEALKKAGKELQTDSKMSDLGNSMCQSKISQASKQASSLGQNCPGGKEEGKGEGQKSGPGKGEGKDDGKGEGKGETPGKGDGKGEGKDGKESPGKGDGKGGQGEGKGKGTGQGKEPEKGQGSGDKPGGQSPGANPGSNGQGNLDPGGTMEKALSKALDQLPKSGMEGMRQALQDMKNNLKNPGGFQEAAEKLGKELDKLAKDLENPDGNDGKNGSDEKNPDASGGDDKPSDPRNRSNPIPNPLTDQPWQKPQQGPNGKGGAGKGAGGKLTQDPKELLKKLKGQQAKAGNKAPDKFKEDDVSSKPQLLSDFEKGTLLTDKDKIKLNIEQEAIARSREIDDFCGSNRVPPTFRTYLKDFFKPSEN